MKSEIPALRITACNGAPVRPGGQFVLYWMTASRRTGWNFALERAVERAGEMGKPLVVLEALRCGYLWASDRHHRFVLDGMADTARRLGRRNVLYHPYVEAREGEGKGLLRALGGSACLVVTDDWPAFFLPRMLLSAARQLDVRLEMVDSCGLLPVRATDRVFKTAFSFRAFLQKELPVHLGAFPKPDPLRGARLPRLEALPARIRKRWPAAGDRLLKEGGLARLPIDHEVGPAPQQGGAGEAERRLGRFLEDGLPRYGGERNRPEEEVTSGLSPYLHFGHVSPHQIFAAVAEREGWSAGRLSPKTGGKRRGWWGMSEGAEGFLDQLVTWRELGLNAACHMPGHDSYGALPGWARATLEEHAADERPHRYTLRQFDGARTHDPLWNAAQTQLRREGRIHNYLRMLWGKKVLEWSRSPRQALRVMIELNDRYALDGRDPNSISGIFWCLGRYDRPWGPERPVFGTVRYMSSENTARKVRVKDYLRRYAPGSGED